MFIEVYKSSFTGNITHTKPMSEIDLKKSLAQTKACKHLTTVNVIAADLLIIKEKNSEPVILKVAGSLF